MPKHDYAHRKTDKELATLEKRISAVYKQAAADMQGKVNAYFQSFAKRDAEQKAKLDAGEITDQYYKQWRLAQIGRGERMEKLRDQLAERMTKANEVSATYINDTTPGIYSLNRNYAAYTIEKEVGADVGFTLWDEQTVKRLVVEQPDIMPYYPPKRAVKRGIDLAWGKKQITAQVTQGILMGESIKHLSDRLQTNIPNMNRDSAIRAARTAVTGAQNAGRMDSYRAAEEMGINLRKQWLATLDGRTRHTHRILDGQTQDIDKPFEVDGREIMYPGDPNADGDLVYNCFVGETLVAYDSKVVRSYKHEYTGKLVEVKTSGGIEFTCTPNHPILTDRGWIAAALLNDGDNLIVTSGRNFSSSRRYSDIKYIHSCMKALHNALYRFGLMSRDSTLSVDFHGDIPASNVEVITKKWLLMDNRYTSGRNSVNEFLFKLSNKSLVCKSAFVKHFRRVRLSSFGFVRRKRKPLSFLRRRLSHSDIHGLRPASCGDISISEHTIDDLAAKSEALSEFLCGFSGKIALDKIVNVKVISSGRPATHVYNLQTKNGYYFVNSSISQNKSKCNGIFAIAKNCRCTMIADIDGADTSNALRRDRAGVLPDMTFSQWENTKRGEGLIAADVYAKKESEREKRDRKQFAEYKEILGKNAPRSFAKFQNLKYNNPEKWNQLKRSVAVERYSKIIQSHVRVDRIAIYNAARNGVRHNGVYVDAMKKRQSTLEKSIASHVSQVEHHAAKIAEPGKFDVGWVSKDRRAKDGLLRKWEKDMQRNAEQAEIEISVWNERFGNDD